MKDIKIDLVYLWVDGNDTNWLEEKGKWARKLGYESEILNKCRYVDNEELRYSLRSAQMYAPWLNKIFIVTNGQIPKWLDINHPKIKIIKHSEIMPKDALPTFNSEAIEACVANIPDLSEYFLLSCDDKFFASPVEPKDFFDRKLNPIVKFRPHEYNKKTNSKYLYEQSYMYNAKLSMKKFPSKNDYTKMTPIHCIEAYRKSYFLECKKFFKDQFKKTTNRKFRTRNSIQHTIVDMFMVEAKNCKLEMSPSIVRQYTSGRVKNLYIAISDIDKMRKWVKNKRPKLLCISDGENVKDVDRNNLKTFMEEIYPRKADWEIPYTEKKIVTKDFPAQYVYAFNHNFVDKFIPILKDKINKSDKKKNHEIVVINKDISPEDKKKISKNLADNFEIYFCNIKSLPSYQIKYIAEFNFMEMINSLSKDDKVLLWGASLFLEECINKYNINNENILGIVDVDKNKKNKTIGKYPIYLPKDILKLKPNKIIVTVINKSKSRKKEIRQFLRKEKIQNIELIGLVK